MVNHSRKMRMAKRRHGGHKKGMSSRHHKKQHHKKSHSKHGKHSRHRSKSHKAGGRSGAGKAGRRMDHYHMRRRLLHAGMAGGMMGGMYDDDMEDNPFFDDPYLDDDLLDDVLEGSESDSDSCLMEEGSDSEDGSQIGDAIIEGPPPLESEDHYHVFIYHSSNDDDQDQMDHYVQILEARNRRGKKKQGTNKNSPNDMRVMTSEKDFKPDLTVHKNLTLAMGFSQKIVLLCTPDFIANDLKNFEATVSRVIVNEEERNQKIIILQGLDVELPESLKQYPKLYSMSDGDCFEKLTKQLMSSGKDHHHRRDGDHAVEPSAPSPDGSLSPPMPGTELKNEPPAKEPTSKYPNGQQIKLVTANKYGSFETSVDSEKGLWESYCLTSDMLCPKQDPEYTVPNQLQKRGLQMTVEEFREVLDSLTEASRVTFFQKAVDCSLPCLYISTMVVVAFISCCIWFLSVGVMNKNFVSGSEDSILTQNISSIFWSFMVLVIFIPSVSALIILAIVMHLVNYKYLKYRIKVEEFNKRFRETNLVLHVRKGFWVCSGNLKLYFFYYNFEKCQQTLYCHVHDNLALIHGEEKKLNDSSTIRLDKIMKRVNTLTKKYEWNYFDALTTNKLPQIEEKEHRKKGMCFCQYVLHCEQAEAPHTVVEVVKERMNSMKSLKHNHSHNSRNILYEGPISNKFGTAKFSPDSNLYAAV